MLADLLSEELNLVEANWFTDGFQSKQKNANPLTKKLALLISGTLLTNG